MSMTMSMSMSMTMSMAMTPGVEQESKLLFHDMSMTMVWDWVHGITISD